MKEERVPINSCFEFLEYRSQKNTSPSTDCDLQVTHNAFWSYCGPILKESTDLPPNFQEWTRAALSGSLLPRLMPFLRFVNEVLRDHKLDHYWLTIRATKATSEFDQPRWHTDDMFFSARGGGLRAVPREDDGKKTLDLQTDWKLCTTLLGPSTMFIPAEHQAKARKTQRSTRKALATDHDCASIRCIACAATSDAVREQLSIDLRNMGVMQAASGECAFFRIGQENGAVHSEPCMNGGDRIFVNVVPGKKDELKNLTSKWGMNSFPRSWWISPSVPRSQEASLWKY
ncbi:hypothetical protein F5B22DRAFT_114871 [Xylaria bambusicola]|uniref:uncharacterized protein n=1 Tax=Xylaria bambusicola TaxID=326684 RepID=UPI002008D85C|nr:uncharacterized protein F5B22DRAFT_114871 [Xylaria bambusicola]KAI0517241.1 hypothetical protein F5B22DRAFT_114871 [Xylaria bambusicola]